MRQLNYLTIIILVLISMSGSATAQDAGVLPPLTETINIPSWHIIGPFLGGPREPFANPLASEFQPFPNNGIPDLNNRYPSTLATGRDVAWGSVDCDADGNLNIKFENVDWDKIKGEWGMGGVYFTGAAYAEFTSSSKCRALADASKIGTFILNGVAYGGDPYGYTLIKTPVPIEEGVNHILFYFGGFEGETQVSFHLEAPPTDGMILDRDILLPDLIRGESLPAGWAGIPVLNTTDQWMTGYSLDLSIDAIGLHFEQKVPPMPPMTVIKIPVDLHFDSVFPADWEGDTAGFKIKLTSGSETVEIISNSRVRKPSDSRMVTFRSGIDNSAQKLAMLFPTDYDPTRNYSLILSLHGASVECEGVVDVYSPKDWAFIVAPTNRRNFGFDWQDWGRLDALEVLNYIKSKYPIDPDRIYLTGHSMGGHGTWHIGTTNNDNFAAMAPSAGWISFPTYIPWYLRQDELYSDPDLKRILDAGHAPDQTELLLANLINTPVLAIHGELDDDVPPTHGRLLTGMLERMGYQAAYMEQPGVGHWWDITPDIPGYDCMDHPRIMRLFQNTIRDPYPDHVKLVEYDLASNNKSYWVTALMPIKPMGRVEIDAERVKDDFIKCKTSNVQWMSINYPGFVGKIEIDGQEIEIPPSLANETLNFKGGDEPWHLSQFAISGTSKYGDLQGPIKRAFFKPFTIVVGVSGGPEETALNMEIARNLAQRWWYRANGYVKIVRDIDLQTQTATTDNLILIGGPGSNLISNEISRFMPIQVGDGGVWLGGKFIEGTDMAMKFVYPVGGRLVQCDWGTSLKGTRLAGDLTCIYSGAGLPDFLIYDDDVRLMGLAGVKAAGFFDNDWELDPDLYYVKY